MSKINSVLIYAGHRIKGQYFGPYMESVQKHFMMFERLHPDVCKVDGGKTLIDQLSIRPLSSTLLVIPAGESNKLDRAFSDAEIQIILDAVKRGLRLFATCGSAYWLSRMRIWNDKCESQPISTHKTENKSRIPIFQGIAKGPLSPYPGQTYSTAFFHEAATIECAEEKPRILLSGGGTFVPAKEQPVEVIATYSQDVLDKHNRGFEWKTAVIGCQLGLGRAVLSMIHPGYGPEDIDVEAYSKAFAHRNDDWSVIRDSLSSLDDRVRFLSKILRYLQTESQM